MSLATRLIAEGNVIRITPREVTVKATGEKLLFHNVLIIGRDCMVEAQMGRDVTHPEIGKGVKAIVEVGVYRDDDTNTIVGYAS